MRARRLLLALFALVVLPWTAQAAERDLAAVADSLVAEGDRLVAAYDPADGIVTSDAFSDLYFDVFEGEGLEAAIGRRDGNRKAELESHFSRIISAAAQNAPATAIQAGWDDLRHGMLEERAHYAGESSEAGGWSAAFIQSFLILLREGVEALLVVGALLAYVQRAGGAGMVRALYAGIGAALVASVATAWAVRASILGLDGRALEAVEGLTMLLAAGVLLYVGHWLISKREAERWQSYVKEKVDAAVRSGSGVALVAAAFLAVYREGAETVLFYQALLADTAGAEDAVAAGFAAAAAVLVVLFFAIRLLGLHLPLKPFFTATAVLLLTLAFIFVGKGIVELQVIRWVSATPLDSAPRLPWLGVFPTIETVVAQVAFLVLVLGGLVRFRKRETAA